MIGAIPPLRLKTPANPAGTPIEAFHQIRAGVVADRSQFFKDLTMAFYGYNRPGAKVSEGVHNAFWLQRDLKKIDVPTLILHGDDAHTWDPPL